MEALDVLKVVLYLVGFCSLLFLTYVTTRYIGLKQNKAMNGKNISVLETVTLGADKRLHLVKAGNSYILIASTAKTVEFLTTVSVDESMRPETSAEERDAVFDFKSLFEKYTGAYRTKKDKASDDEKYDPPQDLAEGNNFKYNLNKLSQMVRKNHNRVKENGDDVTNEEEE